jgi:hypothetical protein
MNGMYLLFLVSLVLLLVTGTISILSSLTVERMRQWRRIKKDLLVGKIRWRDL